MSKKSYREILTRYIQEHKVEDAILTDQVVQYAAEELGKMLQLSKRLLM